jgi:hypothetical protein
MSVSLKTSIIASAIVFALGGMLGYHLSLSRQSLTPEMVTLADRQQIKTELSKMQTVKTVKQNVTTVKTIVKYRSGPVSQTETVTMTQNAYEDSRVQHGVSVETKSKENVQEHSTPTPPERSWSAEARVGRALSGTSNIYSAGVGYRAMGPVWVEAAGTSSAEAFVGFRIEF